MHLTTEYEKSLVLNMAYLVYGSSSPYSNSSSGVDYVSEHPVELVGGVPVIQVGRAVKVESIKQTLTLLARSQGISDVVWTDDFTVVTSSSFQVWWTPAQSRWMHFKSPGLEMSLPGNNPPLVWAASGTELMVFAIKENCKPNATTELFEAPLFNVYAGGRVCQGSMQKPKDGSTKGWVDAFFAATATHANPPNRRLTTYPKGDKALWKHLMTSKKKPEFPVDKLISTKVTLGDLVKRLSK